MKKETNNIPTLRFPEFSNEWKANSFGNIAEFKNGLNFASENRGKGLKIIGVGDFKDNSSITYESLEEVSGFDGLDPSYLLQENDILFVRSNGNKELVGRSLLIKDVKERLSHSGFTIRARITDRRAMPEFVAISLRGRAVRNQLMLEGGGTNIANLNQGLLARLPLPLPLRAEQEKIAAFLSAVDERIAQLQKKKELFLKYKKGVMQQIFSQKIRFKDPNGIHFPDWEEKRLGEIAKFSKGRLVSKEDIVEDGEFECIRYGELYTRYGEVIDVVASKTNLAETELTFSRENDVIIPSSGETNIDIATASCVLRKGIALGGDLTIIRSKVNGVFLSYYLNSAKRFEIAKLAQGVSVVHLYSNHLAALRVKIPLATEQKLIADFLSSLDAKIEAIGKQIEKTKTFKKGLLQQMFV